MNAATIASCALALFILVIASLASGQAYGDADGGAGACAACHPTAHPGGWESGAHADFAGRGSREMEGCVACHGRSYCAYCHGATR